MVDALAGYTKLMLLIEEGNFDGVVELLEKGTDVNAQNKSGQTALTIAAKNGAGAIVSKLLEHGAEINLKNKFGQTALFTACSQNFEDIVKLLIEYNADVNIKDSRGWTPLMIACYHGHANIVKILLHYGADIIAEDSFGKTAINRTKSPEIYQMLTYYAHKELEKYQGSDPTTGDWTQKSFQAQYEPRISSQGQLQKQPQRSSTKDSISYDTLGSQKSPTSAAIGTKNARLSHDQGAAKPSGKTQHSETHMSKQKAIQKEKDQPPSKKETPKRPRLGSPIQTEGDNKGGRYRYKSPETLENSPAKRISTQPPSKAMSRVQSPQPQNPSNAAKKHFSRPTTSEANSRHSRSNNSLIEQGAPNDSKQSQDQARQSQKKAHPVLKAHQPKATPLQQQAQSPTNFEKTVPVSHVKKMLGHYISDYSGLVQNYLREKLSYALGFEVRRCFASAKQELMTSMLENTINLHKEFIETFAVIAGKANSSVLATQFAKCNDDIAAVYQDFENRLLATAEDQDSIQELYQNSQELDALLVRDVEGRYSQKEEEARDEIERDIFRFLKLEMNLQVGNMYNSVNDVLDYEFKSSDAQFKVLIQEIVSNLLGQVSSVLRNSFGQETIEEEDENEEQSQRKQPPELQEQAEEEEESGQQQQHHQHQHQIQHVGYVFFDPTPLQPRDMNKELYKELDNLPHTKGSSQKTDSGAKMYQDLITIPSESEVIKSNDRARDECVEVVIASGTKQKINESTQVTPMRESQQPKNNLQEEKENLELKEDQVIQNIEHISKALDKVLARKGSSGNMNKELDSKKLGRYHSYYLSPGLTPSNSKLSFRDLERSMFMKSEERQPTISITEINNSEGGQSIHQLRPPFGHHEEGCRVEEQRRDTDQSGMNEGKKSLIYSAIYPGQKELSGFANGLTPFEIERTEDSIGQHLDSLELSKENNENSSALVGRDKSLEGSWEGDTFCGPRVDQTQQIYIEEGQSTREYQGLSTEDTEKPQQLTVKEIQQKTAEKIEYFAKMNPQEEAEALLTDTISRNLLSVNFNLIKESETTQMNRVDSFGENTDDARGVPLEEANLSMHLAQSIIVADSARRLHSEFSEAGNLSCYSEIDPSRNALTQSLIIENRDLRADVHSAIRKSHRMQLEYLNSKQKELKQSRYELQ